MEMVSERSNKGKERLIEDGDHYPSQNNLPGSLNQHPISQQQNFGGGGGVDMRAVEEQQRVAKPLAHSASTELFPLSGFTDQITPRRRWTKKLHDHFIQTVSELGGPKLAKPKAITKAMAIPWLTKDNVKSRLQAYREGRITHIWEPPRRPGPGCKSNKAGKIDGQKSASSSASTSNREHGRNGPGVGDQNGIIRLGFQDHYGFFYPFQPGNEYHWAQLEPYCAVLQAQTAGSRHQNGLYNFQHEQVGEGLQEQTPGFRHQNEVYNFEPGNELACVVQQGYELARVVQQPARDGGALRNIQQQNQPQAATDIFQAQNATATTQDNKKTMEDWMDCFSSLNSSQLDFKDLLYQNGVYKFQQENELAHVVQHPAQDGGALGNIQQQNRPQAATDTVQAQNATAITQDSMEDRDDYFNYESYCREPFGIAGQTL